MGKGGSTRRQALAAGLAVSIAPAIAQATPVPDTPTAHAPSAAVPRRRNLTATDRAAYEESYRQSFLAMRRAEVQLHNLFTDILERAGRTDLVAGDLLILFDASEGGQVALLNNWAWHDPRAKRRRGAMVRQGLISTTRKSGRIRHVLTAKGRTALDLVSSALHAQARMAEQVGGLAPDALETTTATLARTERFFVDIVRYKL